MLIEVGFIRKLFDFILGVLLVGCGGLYDLLLF